MIEPPEINDTRPGFKYSAKVYSLDRADEMRIVTPKHSINHRQKHEGKNSTNCKSLT